VDLALEQIGLMASGHVARMLDAEALRPADLVLAVDRGIAGALRSKSNVQVVSLGELAGSEDVPDPHRMPLGVWIAALQTYLTQIGIALPEIRARLGDTSSGAPPAWDEPRTQLLLNTGSGDVNAALPVGEVSVTRSPETSIASGAPGRTEHLVRIARLIDTAETLPEIVDWAKLADETAVRLRALAGLTAGPGDLTPAAAAMVIGSVLQSPHMPDTAGLAALRRVCEQLAQPVDATTLAELAQIAGSWWVSTSQEG
jgi:hypothetical protein